MGLINNAISEDCVLLLLVNLRSLALCATAHLLAESFPLPRTVPPRMLTASASYHQQHLPHSPENPSRVILRNSTLPKPVSLPTSTPLR